MDSELKKVSYPRSPNYGKYWKVKDVLDHFKPKKESLDALHEWFHYHLIDKSNIIPLINNHGIIRINTDCLTANNMLNTQFGYWENINDGTKHLRVKDEYYIPKQLSEHLNFISPTLRFPIRKHTIKISKLSDNDITNNDGSSIYIMPSTLMSLYNIDSYKEVESSLDDININRQGIGSFLNEFYSDDDLEYFENKFKLEYTKTERVGDQPSGYGDEAELDVQYITTTGNNIFTYVFYNNDDDMFITMATTILNDYSNALPYVISISYGGDETDMTYEWANTCNNYFGQLSLLGVTIFASAGDSGVCDESGECIDNKFVPAFPASSPYVTSVGGTKILNNIEYAWEYSGGGFSTLFDRPSWQDNAVSNYLNTVSTLPDKSRFNINGRGYPDISAVSVDYVICIQESFYLVSGTSCSSPTIAGMISKINSHRLANGLAPLGFLNPLLYTIYDDMMNNIDTNKYFNDITSGYNIGCSIDNNIGFYASKGWDPITGVGSPNFELLLQRLLDTQDVIIKSHPK